MLKAYVIKAQVGFGQPEPDFRVCLFRKIDDAIKVEQWVPTSDTR